MPQKNVDSFLKRGGIIAQFFPGEGGMAKDLGPVRHAQAVSPDGEQLLRFYLTANKRVRRAHFCTTEQAACLTGLSQRTMQSWADTGCVTCLRIGRRLLLYVPSLVAHLGQSGFSA